VDHTSTMITVLLLAFLAGLLWSVEGESMVWTVLTVVQQLEFAALFVSVSDGARMRKTIAKACYLLLTELIACI